MGNQQTRNCCGDLGGNLPFEAILQPIPKDLFSANATPMAEGEDGKQKQKQRQNQNQGNDGDHRQHHEQHNDLPTGGGSQKANVGGDRNHSSALGDDAVEQKHKSAREWMMHNRPPMIDTVVGMGIREPRVSPGVEYVSPKSGTSTSGTAPSSKDRMFLTATPLPSKNPPEEISARATSRAGSSSAGEGNGAVPRAMPRQNPTSLPSAPPATSTPAMTRDESWLQSMSIGVLGCDAVEPEQPLAMDGGGAAHPREQEKPSADPAPVLHEVDMAENPEAYLTTHLWNCPRDKIRVPLGGRTHPRLYGEVQPPGSEAKEKASWERGV